MKDQITKRQKELLKFIYSFFENSGYAPTLEEMKQFMVVSSKQAIIDLLNALEKRQLIRKDGTARSIVIRPLGYETLHKTPLVKVAGISAAGPAIEAIEQHEWIPMPNGYRRLENVFVVEISGSSMINAGIYDGDRVLIREAKEFKHGDIVLARIGDDVTLKRFVYDNGRTYLKPENPACRNIAITHETYFLGKMIARI
jgi:repressor LexA